MKLHAPIALLALCTLLCTLAGCATGPAAGRSPSQYEPGRNVEIPQTHSPKAGDFPAFPGESPANGQADRGVNSRPAAPGITSSQAASLDSLLSLTRELLLLAPDVARVRWNAKQALDDTSGEEAMVALAVDQASQLHADTDLFRAFFQAQLDASRYVQAAFYQQWRDAHLGNITLTRTPAQIQSASDDITPRLIQALAKAAPSLRGAGARSLIETRAAEIMPTRSALSDPTRAIAIRPLLERAAD